MRAIRWSLCVVALGSAVTLAACGPRNISALGNPGDFCTERSSCTDGSDCRQTDDGFRCVGGQSEKAPAPTPARSDDIAVDDTLDSGHFAVEAGGEEGDAGLEPMPEEPSGEASAGDELADAGEPQEYLPPSRRRRGRR